MKLIIPFILLFSINVFSQKKEITDTILNKKCNVEIKYDKFNKSTTYTSGFYLSEMPYILIKAKRENETYYYIVTQSVGCKSSDSYISFIFKNGEILKIKYNNDIDCLYSAATFIVEKSDFETLLKNKITDIRICYQSPYDYKISEKLDLKLKSKLYCILNYE